MADIGVWVVEIKGPAGVRQVEITDSQVQFFKSDNNSDPYQAAAWLAYTDLWMTGAGIDDGL